MDTIMMIACYILFALALVSGALVAIIFMMSNSAEDEKLSRVASYLCLILFLGVAVAKYIAS